MTEDKKPLTVKFAPGVLEQLEKDLSPEEMQAFMNELSEMAATGDMTANSQEVDMQALKEEDPELYEILSKQLDGVFDEEPPTLH